MHDRVWVFEELSERSKLWHLLGTVTCVRGQWHQPSAPGHELELAVVTDRDRAQRLVERMVGG